MADIKKDSDLKEEMKRPGVESGQRLIEPVEVPPPPKDWTGHPVSRSILTVIVLAIVALAIWKAPAWIGYFKGNPSAAVVGVIIVVGVIVAITYAYWRSRTKERTGLPKWTTDKKDKPS